MVAQKNYTYNVNRIHIFLTRQILAATFYCAGKFMKTFVHTVMIVVSWTTVAAATLAKKKVPAVGSANTSKHSVVPAAKMLAPKSFADSVEFTSFDI